VELTEKKLEREDKYSGVIIDVHVDKVELVDGSTSLREIVEHPGGVAIVPVDDEGNIYCVRQYRYAMGEELLETPAGKIDEGEETLTCAMRELSEETGFTAQHYEYLGEIYPSPGFCAETLYAYLATGLVRGEKHLDEGEFLEVEKYPFDKLYNMALSGELKDAKSVIAILRAKPFLSREDDE